MAASLRVGPPSDRLDLCVDSCEPVPEPAATATDTTMEYPSSPVISNACCSVEGHDSVQLIGSSNPGEKKKMKTQETFYHAGSESAAGDMSDTYDCAGQSDSRDRMSRPSKPPRSLNFSGIVTPTVQRHCEPDTYASQLQSGECEAPMLRPATLEFSTMSQTVDSSSQMPYATGYATVLNPGYVDPGYAGVLKSNGTTSSNHIAYQTVQYLRRENERLKNENVTLIMQNQNLMKRISNLQSKNSQKKAIKQSNNRNRTAFIVRCTQKRRKRLKLAKIADKSVLEELEKCKPMQIQSQVPDAGSNDFMCSGSISYFDSKDDTISGGQLESEANSKRTRPKQFAMSKVITSMEGPIVARTGGGVQHGARNLFGKVLTWSLSNMSFDNAGRVTAMEALYRATHVWAAGVNGRDIPKDADWTGYASYGTVRQGIKAGNLAQDALISKSLSTYDSIFFSIDGSHVGMNPMQSVAYTLSKIINGRTNIAGNLHVSVEMATGFLNAFPISDKFTTEVHDYDTGNGFAASVPTTAALQFALSGFFIGVLKHRNVICGLDAGGETFGRGQRGKVMLAFDGEGGIIHELFLTRNSLVAAIEILQSLKTEVDGKEVSFFYALLEYFELDQVYQQNQDLFTARSVPDRLDSSGAVNTCTRQLHIKLRLRQRTTGNDQLTPSSEFNKDLQETFKVLGLSDTLSSGISTIIELPVRISLWLDPLRYFILIEGSNVYSEWCLKHRYSLGVLQSVKDVEAEYRTVASVISVLRDKFVFPRLAFNFNVVIGVAKGETAIHLAVREAMGEAALKQLQKMFPHGLTVIAEAAITRWDAVHYAGAQLFPILSVLAAVLIITYAKGTEENRTVAAVSIFSTEGFKNDRRIVFDGSRINKAFLRMISPPFILFLCFIYYFQVVVWGPLQRVTAHNRHCSWISMGGPDSIVRRQLRILREEIFVHLPEAEKTSNFKHRLLWKWAWNESTQDSRIPAVRIEKSKKQHVSQSGNVKGNWNRYRPLQHRGITSVDPGKGLLLLRSVADIGVILGEFAGRDERVNMAQRVLIQTIKRVARMDGSQVLPPAVVSLYKDPQDSVTKKETAAVRWFHKMVENTEQAVVERFDRELFSPNGFLAVLTDTRKIRVVQNLGDGQPLEQRTEEVLIASPRSLASGILFSVMVEEYISKYGNNNLVDCVPGALGSFLRSDKARKELVEFCKGETITFGPESSDYILVLENGYNDTFEITDRNAGNMPKPVNAFYALLHCGMLAAITPTSTNLVESGWSNSSNKHRGGAHRVTPSTVALYVRRMNWKTLNMLDAVTQESFLQKFEEARVHMRTFIDAWKTIFSVDNVLNEKKRMSHMLENLPKTMKKNPNARFRSELSTDRLFLATKRNKKRKTPKEDGNDKLPIKKSTRVQKPRPIQKPRPTKVPATVATDTQAVTPMNSNALIPRRSRKPADSEADSEVTESEPVLLLPDTEGVNQSEDPEESMDTEYNLNAVTKSGRRSKPVQRFRFTAAVASVDKDGVHNMDLCSTGNHALASKTSDAHMLATEACKVADVDHDDAETVDSESSDGDSDVPLHLLPKKKPAAVLSGVACCEGNVSKSLQHVDSDKATVQLHTRSVNEAANVQTTRSGRQSKPASWYHAGSGRIRHRELQNTRKFETKIMSSDSDNVSEDEKQRPCISWEIKARNNRVCNDLGKEQEQANESDVDLDTPLNLRPKVLCPVDHHAGVPAKASAQGSETTTTGPTLESSSSRSQEAAVEANFAAIASDRWSDTTMTGPMLESSRSQDAQRLGDVLLSADKNCPYSIQYAQNVVENSRREDSAVTELTGSSENGYSSCTITRKDGFRFKLRPKSTCTLAIMATDGGLEIINVIKLFRSENVQWSRVKVLYTRVCTTRECHEICPVKSPRGEPYVKGTKVSAPSMGKDYFQMRLESLDSLESERILRFSTVHCGDIAYVTTARRIVGLVGRIAEESISNSDSDRKMLRRVLADIKQCVMIKKMSEIDWVICGQAFADREGMAPTLTDTDSDEDIPMLGNHDELSRTDKVNLKLQLARFKIQMGQGR